MHGKEHQQLREALRGYDNRKNGFGPLNIGTMGQMAAFLHMDPLLREGTTAVRNDDGTDWVPVIGELIPGLDIPF